MDNANKSGDLDTLAKAVLFYPSLGCAGLIGLALVWFQIVPWIGVQIPGTVAQGEKSYKYGVNRSFGYSVEKYRWQRDGFAIAIWAGSSLRLRFDVAGLELIKVKTQRWLAADRAIVLELECIYHDSGGSPLQELGLLYDFERGELHSFGSASSWTLWAPEGRRGRKLSKEQFDRVVAELDAVK